MTSDNKGTLDTLSWSSVPDLIKIYNDEDINCYSYYVLLQLCYSWHTSFSDKNVHILTPDGKVDEYGSSFVVFSEIHLVVFNTRNQNLEKLKLLLKQFVRKHCDWSNIEFGPVEKRFWMILEEAMSENKMKKQQSTLAKRHYMDKESAKQLSITCPENVYIARVKEEDAQLINSVWPHQFDGSLDLIKTIIRRNGGVGVHLKQAAGLVVEEQALDAYNSMPQANQLDLLHFLFSENDVLVCWALHGNYNGPQILQTVESHRRKGYGYLTASAISKYVAEKNIHPVLYIVDKNTPSELLFEKLGYRKAESVKWYHFVRT